MTLMLVVSGIALAAEATLTIESVGGQPADGGRVRNPLSGAVTVTGSASLDDAAAPASETAPLVADAGDSAFVASGQPAPLLGIGYGGSEPYTFAWSSDAGEITGANAPSAELDTTGLAPGTYTASLAITDAGGASASDTVKFVVYGAEERRLLDETRQDTTPGVLGVGVPGFLEFPFEVPAGTSRIDVALSWTLPVNDYDLRVLDPDGVERESSAGGVPETSEATGLNDPQPGTWTVMVDKFATVADTVTVTVDATVTTPDPRPTVDAGGPYSFALGAAQALDGTITGGTAPVAAAWDTNEDGVADLNGTDVTASLPAGRHLVTLKATDAAGLERRQTTSVLVADAARLAAETTAVTVIGIADSGINPYHLEFSAQTYPDPDVLALTENFTRHPSEYIPGYPADAKALPITIGQGYFPAQDAPIWNGNTTIQPGELYWIPGTKIIGAVDAGGSTGVTSGEDTHPILDDNGHGSGSASVSTGNRYGYCPTCLLVMVEALDETVVAGYPWIDISSNSFGYVGGLPIGPVVGPSEATRAAAERGQTTLFAAGNGVGNAFDVPISTYGSDQTGPDWNITVGAIRRDNQRAVIGDGIPVHISAWGDGNLPSACRTGTVGQCAFGGTSAATPYTAGVFGTVLTEIRQAIGDGAAGQKPGQVVASGVPIEASAFLADGKLTRTELRDAVLKTAYPLNTENRPSPFPYPATAPYTGDPNVLFEGYGAATPEGAARAVSVLLGEMPMPERPFEEDFFAIDRSVRDSIYGGYDRDGDGTTDSEAVAGLGLTAASVSTTEGTFAALAKVAELSAPDLLTDTLGDHSLSYFLHRRYAGNPGGSGCSTGSNEQYMDRSDSSGDLEPCFESRVTSVAAAYRPVGIFAATDELDAPLPAGSTVRVDLYIAGETPSVIRPTGVLMATDRELGSGPGAFLPVLGSGPGGAACATLGAACWTHYQFDFATTRHAFTGEALTFQVQLIGARSWAFGFEGAHASKVTIEPADLPASGLDFGVTITEPADGSTVTEGEPVTAGGSYAFPDLGSDPTGAGDHPTTDRVEVSVDEDSFADPIEATLDPESSTWSAPLGELALGEHTIHARAVRDGTVSDVASSTFTVVSAASVEWQVVAKNGATDPAAWAAADGFEAWRFGFDTATYGKGSHTIVVRVVRDGVELARRTAAARFR
ncbi:MAG TPA: S8 family serine peptidase [Candidatus Limnocylindria bacterium]|nr:S8 family serine peptidase [Candidatus Limnocylindria bacterium]